MYYVLIQAVLLAGIIRAATCLLTEEYPFSCAQKGRHAGRSPAYAEPAIGWNTEDNKAGVIKYGVADYEPRTSKAPIRTPTRPALPAPLDAPQDGGDGDMLALM